MFKTSITFAIRMIFGETLAHYFLKSTLLILRFRMRDKRVRVLTVGSLLFYALKFYILSSPKILLQLFEEETLLFRSVYLI